MKISQFLCTRRWPKRRQYEGTYPIPFQDVLSIELRNRVSLKDRKDEVRPCVPELTVLLQCFKDSDFNQKRCADVLKKYYDCIAVAKEKEVASGSKKTLTDARRLKDLTPELANQLLKKKPI